MKKFDNDIIYARKCPYCGGKPKYISGNKLYNKNIGMIYVCENCDAYIGVYGSTKRPLGRLANSELRKKKQETNYYINAIIQKAVKKGQHRSEAKKSTLKWLGNNLEVDVTHMQTNMFDIDLCEETIKLCKPYCKEYYKENKTEI